MMKMSAKEEGKECNDEYFKKSVFNLKWDCKLGLDSLFVLLKKILVRYNYPE